MNDEPETIDQAIVWETTKNAYLRDGLCHRCAAQAAWGHQCGWPNGRLGAAVDAKPEPSGYWIDGPLSLVRALDR